MNYRKIDLKTWERLEHFEAFMLSGTSFSLTTKIDVTHFYKKIKQKQLKFYPMFIHQTTMVVNSFENFRLGYNEKNELVLWDNVEPNYTINSKVSENFISVWTPWIKSTTNFQQSYLKTLTSCETSFKMTPQNDMPMNIFVISMLPWTSFDGFNLNINNNDKFITPIITAGKIINENEQLLLPLAIQVHHASCDGYHVGRFLEKLQNQLNLF